MKPTIPSQIKIFGPQETKQIPQLEQKILQTSQPNPNPPKQQKQRKYLNLKKLIKTFYKKIFRFPKTVRGKVLIIISALVAIIFFGFVVSMLQHSFVKTVKQDIFEHSGKITLYTSQNATVSTSKMFQLNQGKNTIYLTGIGLPSDLSILDPNVSSIALPQHSQINLSSFAGIDVTLNNGILRKKNGHLIYYNSSSDFGVLYGEKILINPKGEIEISCPNCKNAIIKTPQIEIESKSNTQKELKYSYTVDGLLWKPSYLIILDNQPKLILYAKISNNSQIPVHLFETTFVSNTIQNELQKTFLTSQIKNSKDKSQDEKLDIWETSDQLDLKIQPNSEAKINLMHSFINPFLSYKITEHELLSQKTGFANIIYTFQNTMSQGSDKLSLPSGEIKIINQSQNTSLDGFLEQTAQDGFAIVDVGKSYHISYTIQNNQQQDGTIERILEVKNSTEQKQVIKFIQNIDKQTFNLISCQSCQHTTEGFETIIEVKPLEKTIFKFSLAETKKTTQK